MASTEKDRTLIKYVAIKAQKLNTTQSRQMLGIHSPKALIDKVQEAILQQQQIRETLWDLASDQASAYIKAKADAGSDDEPDPESR